MKAVMFSSARQDWETPQALFDELDREFGFTFDVCALPHNAKCERFYAPVHNALDREWSGVCWMNPPYGRGIYDWVKKAYNSAQTGATVVCLLPARTDTKWFHEFCVKGEIRYMRGRVKFVGAQHPAPFPSMIVIFRKGGAK